MSIVKPAQEGFLISAHTLATSDSSTLVACSQNSEQATLLLADLWRKRTNNGSPQQQARPQPPEPLHQQPQLRPGGEEQQPEVASRTGRASAARPRPATPGSTARSRPCGTGRRRSMAASITRSLKRIGSLPVIMAEPHSIEASAIPARAPSSAQRSKNDFLIWGSSLPALLPRGYLFRTRW
jgi:hypothetical protein